MASDAEAAFAQAATADGVVLGPAAFHWLCEQGHVGLERVRQRAVGQEVLQSLTPGHQVVKLVWEELRDLMGQGHSGVSLAPVPPTVVMMVGLQGAGKTTTCGKLARLFKQQGRRPLLHAGR